VALKIPAILIPLPWSAGREQQKHAEIFVKAGLGEIFHQVETSDKLLRLIRSMGENLELYKKNFDKLNSSHKENAAKYLVDEIIGQA
jgi:UDP-N-acetylglucosamine:LPS N-acetylglucosamine transferase